jgi:hypothetical protein
VTKRRDDPDLKCVLFEKEAEYLKDGTSLCEDHFKQYIQRTECLPKAQNTSDTKEMLFLLLGVAFGATLGFLGSIIGAWEYEANKRYSWFIYVVDFSAGLFIVVSLFLLILIVHLCKRGKLRL